MNKEIYIPDSILRVHSINNLSGIKKNKLEDTIKTYHWAEEKLTIKSWNYKNGNLER